MQTMDSETAYWSPGNIRVYRPSNRWLNRSLAADHQPHLHHDVFRKEDLHLKAAHFSALCHKDQRRKYTNEPYIIHPLEVAMIVASVPHDEEMLAAAMLHDVVENCDVSLDYITRNFGIGVSELVMSLTDDKTIVGNRAYRKNKALERLSKASGRAQTIKLADLISNTSDIVDHDPGFAKIYLAEKEALLDVMTDGSLTLYARARSMIVDSLYRLERIAA